MTKVDRYMPRVDWVGAGIFYDSLSGMLRAGIDVADALAAAGAPARGPHHHLSRKWAMICSSGTQLSVAMRADGMPALEVALVAAGERSGMLVEICKTLSGYYRQFAATRRAAIGRLVYPVFLLHFALVVVTVPWIAPKIVDGNTAALGWLLIGPVSLWVFLFLAWLFFRWLGPDVRSALIQRVPGLAGCTEAWVVTNVCMVLRATNGAGMLVPQSMELAAEAAGHRLMSARLSTIAKTMFGGPLTMSQALAKAGFPNDVIARLQVAEHGGSADEVLDLLVLDWRERFDRRLAILAGVCTSTVYALAMLAAVMVIFGFFSSYFGNIAKMAQDAGG